MRTLSFDTSTSTLHVCLLEGRQAIWEVELAPQGSERQEVASLLMPTVDRAFSECGWPRSAPDLIVVGTGPGSFTGIRVSVITARTLADALGIALVGVPLLETYFVGAAGATKEACEKSVGIALGTTSKMVFVGTYQSTQGDPAAALSSAACLAADAAAAELSKTALRLADEKAISALPAAGLQPLPFIKNIASIQSQLVYDRLSLKRLLPSPGLTRQKLAETFPWQEVLPLYLRNPSVTVKKDYATPNPPHERS